MNLIILCKKLRSPNGTKLFTFEILLPHKYLLYPANSSSPPSPDNATLTFFLVNLLNKKVGIADESNEVSQ